IAIAGAKKDASILPIRPVGDATMHEAVVRGCSVLPRLRVIDPKGLAGRGLEDSDLGKRSADIQNGPDHQWRGLPHPCLQIICFRDLFFGGFPGPRSRQATEVADVNLGEPRVLRARLIPAVARPFRRRALDLLRLRMHRTTNMWNPFRALGRMHDGGHSSQQRHCEQGRPGYQSVAPTRHGMDMFLIGVVTWFTHERSPSITTNCGWRPGYTQYGSQNFRLPE